MARRKTRTINPSAARIPRKPIKGETITGTNAAGKRIVGIHAGTAGRNIHVANRSTGFGATLRVRKDSARLATPIENMMHVGPLGSLPPTRIRPKRRRVNVSSGAKIPVVRGAVARGTHARLTGQVRANRLGGSVLRVFNAMHPRGANGRFVRK
jgi:hypothetical protein